MSATSQNNDNQEIDLSQISKKIGGFFEGISVRAFKIILFFKRNLIWVSALFILGAGLGLYLDKTTKVYDSEIIVSPNFGSVDYMDAKIALLDSKIEDADTVFLRDVVGIKDISNLKNIEVEPITDVYKFIDNKPENFELIKLMAEDGDIKKVINENLTSKNYPYHRIGFTTLGETSKEKTVQPILDYLNDSDYYKKIQGEYVNNVKVKMAQNDSIISQIDGVLNTFKRTADGPSKNDKLVYYNENTQLNEIIKTKDQLIYELGAQRLNLINLDKIIKETSSTLNVKKTENVNGKMKFILPILFIMLFVIIAAFKTFYKKQMAKINT